MRDLSERFPPDSDSIKVIKHEKNRLTVTKTAPDTYWSEIFPTNPSPPLSVIEILLSFIDNHRIVGNDWPVDTFIAFSFCIHLKTGNN